MAKKRNLIFDFDGTLVDTAPLIIRTMKAAMKELELPENGLVTDFEVRCFRNSNVTGHGLLSVF